VITIDGSWVMEGLESNDEKRIKSSKELNDFINDIGFLPLFKNRIEGFSVEELTAKNAWWSGNLEDPWAWRETIASEGEIAYGKLFSGKAGFVSKRWYPIFAAFRRDGYDFDSRYEDGLASHRAKKVMDLFSVYETLPSFEIKKLAGFGKDGEKGFEGVMTSLQMQTYITVRAFQRKANKKGEEYGWPVSVYSLSEKLFGEDFVRCAYYKKAKEAKAEIARYLQKRFPQTTEIDIEKCIK
jgi:hypothetical protein